MYKLCVYIPVSHIESVKAAMFDAGGGKIGNYDRCAWQVLGCGQFRPLENSNPHLGQLNQVETVDEYRVEMVCDPSLIQRVVNAMKQAHPYEEPAYDVVRLERF